MRRYSLELIIENLVLRLRSIPLLASSSMISSQYRGLLEMKELSLMLISRGI
jgi:hypothetical protein